MTPWLSLLRSLNALKRKCTWGHVIIHVALSILKCFSNSFVSSWWWCIKQHPVTSELHYAIHKIKAILRSYFCKMNKTNNYSQKRLIVLIFIVLQRNKKKKCCEDLFQNLLDSGWAKISNKTFFFYLTVFMNLSQAHIN